MSKNTPELYRKNVFSKSKWFDDIKKDIIFYGVGTVNNQIHYPNGAKDEKPFEDRSFAYEFKKDLIYAYGLLDGYNGIWAVDLVEQCILTNMYFDHLATLEKKTDEEILAILQQEFIKTEQTLQDNLQEKLMQRAALTIQAAELKKGSIEYVSNVKKIRALDEHLNSGSFAMIALIIENRLFVSNVGTSHCFICKFDEKTNEKQVISVETVHKTTNYLEMMRLIKLKSNLALESSFSMENPIEYTRCLGEFKLKHYYHEFPQFSNCTGPPIICKPSNPSSSINIDETFLFMVMYPDGLAKAIEETDLKGENTDAKIARCLIEKILNEQTLNSAAQSVLDEIKRTYDDKYRSAYSEREDLTLIVRAFDPNIKARLTNLDSKSAHKRTGKRNSNSKFESTLNNYQEPIETSDIDEEEYVSNSRLSSMVLTDNDRASMRDRKKSINEVIDKNGCVIPYINLKKEFDKLFSSGCDANVFEEFENELINLRSDEKRDGPDLESVIEET